MCLSRVLFLRVNFSLVEVILMLMKFECESFVLRWGDGFFWVEIYFFFVSFIIFININRNNEN